MSSAHWRLLFQLHRSRLWRWRRGPEREKSRQPPRTSAQHLPPDGGFQALAGKLWTLLRVVFASMLARSPPPARAAVSPSGATLVRRASLHRAVSPSPHAAHSPSHLPLPRRIVAFVPAPAPGPPVPPAPAENILYLPPSPATLPALDAVFFVMKSFSGANLATSIARGIWATQPHNEPKLAAAHSAGKDVILFFSLNGSGCFQGWARMVSPLRPRVAMWPGETHHHLGSEFSIQWEMVYDLSFHLTGQLYNPLNENLPVKVSRDGQELTPTLGHELVAMMERGAKFTDTPRPPRRVEWVEPPPAAPQDARRREGGRSEKSERRRRSRSRSKSKEGRRRSKSKSRSRSRERRKRRSRSRSRSRERSRRGRGRDEEPQSYEEYMRAFEAQQRAAPQAAWGPPAPYGGGRGAWGPPMPYAGHGGGRGRGGRW
jgi:YT521-B-like domain